MKTITQKKVGAAPVTHTSRREEGSETILYKHPQRPARKRKSKLPALASSELHLEMLYPSEEIKAHARKRKGIVYSSSFPLMHCPKRLTINKPAVMGKMIMFSPLKCKAT